MTWKELIEKSKVLNYDLHYELYYLVVNGERKPVHDDIGSYYLENELNKIPLVFWGDGKIEASNGLIIATDRTYEQMYQIMIALRQVENGNEFI